MSPSAALASDVFRIYVMLLVGLLIVAGAAILVLRRALGRNVAHARAAYLGWLMMIPALLLVIFLGRAATIVFFTAVAAWGFCEFARATRLDHQRLMCGVVYLAILGCGLLALVSDPNTETLGWYGMYMALPVFVIAAILAIPILSNRAEGQLRAISLAALGFLYFGWMFGHLALLADTPNAYGYLLYLLFAVELNDVAAFTFGSLLGRHPLRSNISPNKTWEGSLGALAVSLVLPWVLWFSFPRFTPLDLLLTGLIVGVGGQMGDLSISVIKRDLAIKDMGIALPGHGGILDRIDSMIYVAPLFFHVTRYNHDLF